jgi:hypothetical protein
MTSQSPRIYTYKITFEEVPYYYYGSKKEKYFDEEYWGSPVTNKWCWEFYTPKKQILELFDFTDKGYIEAQEVEGRLIKPVYNTDKWCLNANCNGKISLSERRKAGKKGGLIGPKKAKELGVGIFGLSKEKRSETGKKSAQKARENKTGIFALTKEQLSENSKKGIEKMKENNLGIFGLSKEEKMKNSIKGGSIGGKIGGKTNRENGTGIFALTKEQRSANSKRMLSEKWKCTETGYISNPSGLSKYQNRRGIDTTKRIRVE